MKISLHNSNARAMTTAKYKYTKRILICIISIGFIFAASNPVWAQESKNKKSAEELDEKYRKLFEPAKDELDYLWDTDYNEIKGAHSTRICDSKAYETVFGEKKPTLKDISATVKKNKGIPKKYKEFIVRFVDDYMKAYPDADFTLFKQNLKTLKINECTADEIRLAAVSVTAVACYRNSENAIYILKDSDIEDKSSNDYIILAHELTHAARGMTRNQGKERIRAGFYSNIDFGYYVDETLDTYFMYQLQGLNKKPTHYTISSNYFRIFMDALKDTYTGSDYMNHSINYLAAKMDEFMGDEMYAYHILAQIESLNIKYYTEYIEADYDDFTDLNEYTIRMYLKNHLKKGMKRKDAEKLLADFMDEITFNYENLTREYIELTEKDFRPEFERVIKEYGIK